MCGCVCVYYTQTQHLQQQRIKYHLDSLHKYRTVPRPTLLVAWETKAPTHNITTATLSRLPTHSGDRASHISFKRPLSRRGKPVGCRCVTRATLKQDVALFQSLNIKVKNKKKKKVHSWRPRRTNCVHSPSKKKFNSESGTYYYACVYVSIS